MNVVKLVRHKNRGLVSALKALQHLAERGEIQGITFVVKHGPRDHRAGFAGEYERDSTQLLHATLTLKNYLLCDMT